MTTRALVRAGRLGLGLLALLVAGLRVHAQSDSMLTGRVLNGTSGGPEIGAGLPVILHVTQGGAERGSVEAATDEQGGFEFSGLDTDPELAYALEVSYQQVAYSSSQVYSFAEGQAELETEVTVYETTEDAAGVRIDSLHMILESFDQVLRISEVHVLANGSDRTFVGNPSEGSGGKRLTVFIPLPKNAVGVAFPDDEESTRFIEAEGGIWDTAPVLPGAGTSVVRHSYHLLTEGGSLALEHGFAYPVSVVSLLAVQPGLALRGERLAAGDSITFGEKAYTVYEATNFGPDTPLSVEVVSTSSNSPAAMPETADAAQAARESGSAGEQGVLRWLGFGLTVLAVLGPLAYPFVTRPQRRA